MIDPRQYLADSLRQRTYESATVRDLQLAEHIAAWDMYPAPDWDYQYEFDQAIKRIATNLVCGANFWTLLHKRGKTRAVHNAVWSKFWRNYDQIYAVEWGIKAAIVGAIRRGVSRR